LCGPEGAFRDGFLSSSFSSSLLTTSLSHDAQNRSKNLAPRIYVPEAEPGIKAYYERIAKEKPHLGLLVDTVPTDFDAAWVRDQNEKPGILALAMKETTKENGEIDYQGLPFVVPGARFNEVRLLFLSPRGLC
jgi:alpha,alpha-trehalase